MKRSARKYIDIEALRHNFAKARQQARQNRILAVVKADAYGHGSITVAEALSEQTDGFAVACVLEAEVLREAGILKPILVLQGFQNEKQLRRIAQLDLWTVVHQTFQLELIAHTTLTKPLRVWIKLDTGMHRLGFPVKQAADIYQKLSACCNVLPDVVWMSHLACADEPCRAENSMQLACFNSTVQKLPGLRSLANSAALLTTPAMHGDWVRPGILLYGASPLTGCSASALGLRPVMTLKAPLIAIHQLQAGSYIGYGSTYQCHQDMRVGVVAIGYADGYPRHAPSHTPVLLHAKRLALLGRVSMDMISIDLSNAKEACIGDQVTLWGEGLAVDEIAAASGTIAYDLLSNVKI